jgi:hypothetical protein
LAAFYPGSALKKWSWSVDAETKTGVDCGLGLFFCSTIQILIYINNYSSIKWSSYDLIGFLKALPWSKVPRVVVLDNACFHTSKVVRAARKGLAELKIYLYFLPPYSPELNRIEPVFRQVQHQEIPQRSHTTRVGLRETVESGFINYARKLCRRSRRELRPAA